MSTPAWEQWEHEVQDALDLASTPGSGNQWHAPSDGRTVGHPTDVGRGWMVDCKTTVQKSFSLTRKMLGQWEDKAAVHGHRFLLPLRFLATDRSGRTQDYAVLSWDDFLELNERAGRADAGDYRVDPEMTIVCPLCGTETAQSAHHLCPERETR